MEKFKTQFNFTFGSEQMEKVKDAKSVTCPDMSHTVRELLIKYTSGQPIRGHDPVYDEDVSFDSIPDPIDWDLTDITEAKLEIDSLQSKIELAQKAIAEKEAEEAAAKQAATEANS